MQHLSQSKILQQFSQPAKTVPKETPGSIAVFPTGVLDMPQETFKNTLKRREENHRELIRWIQKNLLPDIDYGRCHVQENCRYARAGVSHQCCDFSHMSMITLWKSGAEKIIRLLGLSVHYPNLNQYELACVHKQEISTIVLKCELRTSNGVVVAEGTGSRHIKQDDWNLNKGLKMAVKSAMIDATIRVAALTGVFIKTHRHTENKLSFRGNHPDNGNVRESCKAITAKQKQFIQQLAGRKGMTIGTLNKQCFKQYGADLATMTRTDASEVIKALKSSLNQEYKPYH